MEEDENKLSGSFISRWSKRKSGVVSTEDNQELNENLKKEEGKITKKLITKIQKIIIMTSLMIKNCLKNLNYLILIKSKKKKA